jgi:hypothetical protein
LTTCIREKAVCGSMPRVDMGVNEPWADELSTRVDLPVNYAVEGPPDV